jgi:hypothetical protein
MYHTIDRPDRSGVDYEVTHSTAVCQQCTPSHSMTVCPLCTPPHSVTVCQQCTPPHSAAAHDLRIIHVRRAFFRLIFHTVPVQKYWDVVPGLPVECTSLGSSCGFCTLQVQKVIWIHEVYNGNRKARFRKCTKALGKSPYA